MFEMDDLSRIGTEDSATLDETSNTDSHRDVISRQQISERPNTAQQSIGSHIHAISRSKRIKSVALYDYGQSVGPSQGQIIHPVRMRYSARERFLDDALT